MSHYTEKVYTQAELNAIPEKIECPYCGGELSGFLHYPHDGGVLVEGIEAGKVWVYFRCLKCKYEWALWKLENRLARFLQAGVAELRGSVSR